MAHNERTCGKDFVANTKCLPSWRKGSNAKIGPSVLAATTVDQLARGNDGTNQQGVFFYCR